MSDHDAGGALTAEATERTCTANLDKVDHVVVVMLENRSFDHLLGYLSLHGGRQDIDGLHPGLVNEHDGRTYPIHHLASTAVDVDPDHSSPAIDRQIAGGDMSGFVASLARTLADDGVPDGDPAIAMGYYNGSDLPVYDHLAREFTVCNRWFSSVPGSTLPNRLYALAGSAAGSRDDVARPRPPLYQKSSFVRHLDANGVSWRWYSFDPGTLRLSDAHYLLGHHQQFAYFSKAGLPWRTKLDITVNDRVGSFLEDAASGSLPAVSWIDPAFTNFNPLGFPVNDDHPPADVRDGQDLVLAIYDALAGSPHWDTSLLVVVYDEHGGFYDHVPPPRAVDDDPVTFGGYGVRVPAMIVSPWVEPQSVTDTLFDHTSIIKTILLRFCPETLDSLSESTRRSRRLALGQPQYLGARVAHANHLGELLTRATPRRAPSRDALLRDAAARTDRTPQTPGLPVDAPRARDGRVGELQQSILAARAELTRLGHPADRP
jgi:phospholipase C